MSLTEVSQCLFIVLGVVVFDSSALSDTLTVLGTDDIYAAGQSTLPDTIYPGTFPPSDSFAADPNQILTFSSVTGMVGCNFVITNGPDGTCFPGVNTTVTSYGGLSGIEVKNANMFLVGVFLDNTEPGGSSAPVLNYNYGTTGSLKTTDASFSPELDQVFFIGDGLTGTGTGQEQDFSVPSDATRLYLGFADSFDSVPSYYADNPGSLTATFAFTTEQSTVPEPTHVFLVTGALLIGVALYRGRSGRRLNDSCNILSAIHRISSTDHVVPPRSVSRQVNPQVALSWSFVDASLRRTGGGMRDRQGV
jgi:hypothetical protein